LTAGSHSGHTRRKREKQFGGTDHFADEAFFGYMPGIIVGDPTIDG